MKERLQKVLAEAGIASRRVCEQYITDGRVDVNGKTVRELGTKADPLRDVITFDGEKIALDRKYYFALNKPRGIICTSEDTHNRKKVVDLFTGISSRLYTVGRLDLNSEGLIFVTNDGSFSNAVLHPKQKIEKTYLVHIDRMLTEKEISRLEKGIWFDGEKTLPAKVSRPIINVGQRWQVKIIIHEGRKRQLRRMFEILDCKVRRLKRIQIGSVTLGTLSPGEYRPLKKSEIVSFTGE